MGSTPSAVWHTVWYLSGVTIHVFDSTRATSCKFRSVHVYNLEGMLVSKFSINHCLEQVNRNLVIFCESNDYIYIEVKGAEAETSMIVHLILKIITLGSVLQM